MTSVAAGNKGLTLASLRRVRRLWQEDVQRLTLAELRALGGNCDAGAAGQLEAARRTHRELKVRIGHRLRDFLFLPYKVMANPSVRLLYEKYVCAYSMHEEFGELRSEGQAAKYWLALARTFEEHQHVTRLLGNGRRQLIRLDPELAPILDAFFDRFFVSRIGTHLLGAHFLNIGPVPPGSRKPAGVAMGVLQPTCPAGFVRDLASSLSTSSGACCAPVDVHDAMGASILYIPGHLRGILREILQNAMTASVRAAAERGSDPVPVRVEVNRGQFGVFVTVSDQGGGIPCVESIWNWGDRKVAATAPEPAPEAGGWSDGEAEVEQPARLPLGFGLPLARLTARYFGGDVRLQTLLGYGTNAYVHIPELQEEGALGADDSGGSFF